MLGLIIHPHASRSAPQLALRWDSIKKSATQVKTNLEPIQVCVQYKVFAIVCCVIDHKLFMLPPPKSSTVATLLPLPLAAKGGSGRAHPCRHLRVWGARVVGAHCAQVTPLPVMGDGACCGVPSAGCRGSGAGQAAKGVRALR